MEFKGKLGATFTEKGQEEAEERLIDYGMKDFKEKFSRAYRSANRKLDGVMKDLDTVYTSAHEDILSGDSDEDDTYSVEYNGEDIEVGFVDYLIIKKSEAETLKKEIESIKAIYKETFDEDFVG